VLTRLEVDGFKNLIGFSAEFGPFTCIAGENGAGKSNVFDAIELLSLLADHSLMDAAQELRSTKAERSGDPGDLFWNGFLPDRRRISISAEVIVPPEVEDDFGRVAKPSITFLRYSVEIGYEQPQGKERMGRLVLLSEHLEHINQGDAMQHLAFQPSKPFRESAVQGRRSAGAFISTVEEDGETIIKIHQDGGSRGRPRPAAARRAPATVVSTITTSESPTILALRRELQSWRRLALEPSALRAPDRYVDPQAMTSDGRHLPATLYRIAAHYGDDARLYARVVSRLAALTKLDARQLVVDADDAREQFSIKLRTASGAEIPARSLSEGTLRFLALCVLLEDPDATGVICMEEPENGIHPANAGAMVNLIRDLAADDAEAVGDDNPFRQVIVNTHSPLVVQLVGDEDLLFAVPVATHAGNDRTTSLQLRPMVGTWRADRLGVPSVTKADILPYLTEPAGAQLRLGSANG
jgi:predicted ATPase